MMKPRLLFLISVALLSSGSEVGGSMTFYALAVGQGDSAIIQCPNGKDLVIVDMGAINPSFHNSRYIIALLKKKFGAADKGKNIHILVTHPHYDHYSHFSYLLDSDLVSNVRSFILGGEFRRYNQQLRQQLLDKVSSRVYTINNQNKCFGNKDCILTSVTWREDADIRSEAESLSENVKDPWQFCSGSTDVKFTVLGANIGNRPNEQSVILKVQYKSWSMLMSGDFESSTRQKELMKHYSSNPGIFRSSYYKVAHHGSWAKGRANLPALLNLIQPKKVYISHGYPNLTVFHHPNSGTIKHLTQLKSIVTVPPCTNAPFVFWDLSEKRVVELTDGLGRAIYETCRSFVRHKQVCHDIEIITNGLTDTTRYVGRL